jgi:hypothetical protein
MNFASMRFRREGTGRTHDVAVKLGGHAGPSQSQRRWDGGVYGWFGVVKEMRGERVCAEGQRQAGMCVHYGCWLLCT